MSKADTFHYWVANGDLTPQTEPSAADSVSTGFDAKEERTPYQYGESNIADSVSNASLPPSYDSSDEEYFSRTPYQDASFVGEPPDPNSHDTYID